jgi:1-acyl-sn-glycerol-3-phosphate acyltransferase
MQITNFGGCDMYIFYKIVFGWFFHLYFRFPKVTGKENVPKEGAAIIASNHKAAIDSLILPILAPRQIFFMGKDEYFRDDTIKHKFHKWFFESVGVFPVNRSGGKASEAAINASLKVLNEGKLFGIYPEGTRSTDGKLHKLHTGIVRVALSAHVPIIPTAIVGTEQAQPLGKTFPKSTKLSVIFGEPIHFDEYYNEEITYELLHSLAYKIAMGIQKLSSQEYVDEYAKRSSKLIKGKKQRDSNE